MKSEAATQENLLSQFITAAEEAAATVETVERSPKALNTALLKAIRGKDGVILAEPDDLDLSLFEPFRENSQVVVDPTEEQLSTFQVGITDAFAGIARTGSVCVTNSQKLSGAVSLFTREHIVVLDSDCLVEKPREVFTSPMLKQKGLKRSFVFVTGPSATADMGTLVRGVHGPGKLHIILLE
jgi:L-lactate dehydrogenase complex protein LldG